jgi:hypothetical protein
MQIFVEQVAVMAGSNGGSDVMAKSDDFGSGILDGRTRSMCVMRRYY